MACSSAMISTTCWPPVMAGNMRCTGPDKPGDMAIVSLVCFMPGLTYERAVDDDPDDPHDLHGGLPASDVLHSLRERSL